MRPLWKDCVTQAQHQERVQGYVRFSDIAKSLNISRQRCDLLFKRAIYEDLITEEQLRIWKESYKLRTTRAEFALLRTHEAWLKSEAERLDLSWHDVLNRVLQQHIHHHANVYHP